MSAPIDINVDIDPKIELLDFLKSSAPFNAIKVYVDRRPLTLTLKSGILPEVLAGNVSGTCEIENPSM